MRVDMAWYHSQGRSPREWYQAISTRDPRDYFSRSKSPAGTVLLLLNTTILTFLCHIIPHIIPPERDDMGDDMDREGWYGGWYGFGGMIWGMIWAHIKTHIIPHIIPENSYHPPYHPSPCHIIPHIIPPHAISSLLTHIITPSYFFFINSPGS